MKMDTDLSSPQARPVSAEQFRYSSSPPSRHLKTENYGTALYGQTALSATIASRTTLQNTAHAVSAERAWAEGGNARPRPPLPLSALRKHAVNLRSRPHGHGPFRSRLRKTVSGAARETRHGRASPRQQVAEPRRRGAGDAKAAEGRRPGPPPSAPRRAMTHKCSTEA